MANLRAKPLQWLGYRKYMVKRFVWYCAPYCVRATASPGWESEHLATISIGDVMDAVENRTFWDGDNYRVAEPSLIKAFRERLRRLGVTADDWLYIEAPEDAMRLVVERAASISKQALLDLDIRMLGSAVSRDVLERLDFVFAYKGKKYISIGDMLSLHPKVWVRAYADRDDRSQYFGSNVGGSVTSIREKLRSFGLGHEDGGIMHSARELRITDMCEVLRVSREDAIRILKYYDSDWHKILVDVKWAFDE